MLKEVDAEEAVKLKYPEPVALVSCTDKSGKVNFITIGWFTTCSRKPRTWAISIGKSRYSHKCLEEVPEFVLCLPSEEQKKDILYCGSVSGRDVDKLKNCSFKAMPSKYVKPPLIDNSAACFECKIIDKMDAKDHTVFLGEVKAAYVSGKTRKLYNFGDAELRTL